MLLSPDSAFADGALDAGAAASVLAPFELVAELVLRLAKKPPPPGVYRAGADVDGRVSILTGVRLCTSSLLPCGALVLPELFAWRFAKNPPDPGVYLVVVSALAGVLLFCVVASVASSLAAGTVVLPELFA